MDNIKTSNTSKFLLGVYTLCNEGPLKTSTVIEMKNRFKIKTYKKGTKICCSRNNNQNKISYLRKGLVRGYIQINNKNITNWVSKENEFFASANFFDENFFMEEVEALEDVTIEYLEFQDYKYLLNYDDFRAVSYKLLSNYYVWANRRALISRIPNSMDRLIFFLKNYDNELIYRCPNKYLAEFLNMRTETFSRLLKKINL